MNIVTTVYVHFQHFLSSCVPQILSVNSQNKHPTFQNFATSFLNIVGRGIKKM